MTAKQEILDTVRIYGDEVRSIVKERKRDVGRILVEAQVFDSADLHAIAEALSEKGFTKGWDVEELSRTMRFYQDTPHGAHSIAGSWIEIRKRY